MTSSSHSGLSESPYSLAAKARMPGIKETATGVRNQVMPINCAGRPNRNIRGLNSLGEHDSPCVEVGHAIISRGGRTTKIHAIVDSKGRPLSFMVTGGQVH